MILGKVARVRSLHVLEHWVIKELEKVQKYGCVQIFVLWCSFSEDEFQEFPATYNYTPYNY